VQRTLKFAKYLPEQGVETVVVTGPARRSTRHAPLDVSLGLEVPPGCRVERIEAELPDDTRPYRLRRLLGRPSRFAQAWTAGCLRTALRVGSAERIDVVVATMSPFETSVAAADVAARLRVPWVADLRDPWALDEMIVYPSRWHRALELRRMRRCLSSAALVIMNTPEAARAVGLAFPELAPRTLSITNGFDADDFSGEPPPRSDGRFRIVHTGSLHADLGYAQRRRRWLRRLVGGERVPVDILARSHVHLLAALEQWRRQHPAEAERSVLVLAGRLGPLDRELVQRSAVADLVRMPGFLSHAETVQQLRSADLLFLPMHGLPRGERARIVPGKTYEYLAAGKPILAAVPEGDARDFVRASGLGWVCEPDDVGAMAEILRQRFLEARAGGAPGAAPPAFSAQFERRQLAIRLARALESVTRGSRPG
jgi:glycosyltransferase involved in cell wall biosynthesis